jgi:hypothetical protein
MNKAWFCLCIPESKPDGPAAVFGFYPEKEWAEDEAIHGCSGNHVIVYGPGSETIAEKMDTGVSIGYSNAVEYWKENPHLIPLVLIDWFGRTHP